MTSEENKSQAKTNAKILQAFITVFDVCASAMHHMGAMTEKDSIRAMDLIRLAYTSVGYLSCPASLEKERAQILEQVNTLIGKIGGPPDKFWALVTNEPEPAEEGEDDGVQ